MSNRVGQQLGNYHLQHLLGSGGFAEVYLGQHVWIQSKQAAIKVLHSQIEKDYIADFQREAELIAALHHPHIVPILDYAVEQGVPYLIMDYYPEGTLRKRHPRGTRLPLTHVIAYVKQAAEALQFAHEHKLIHRDVKPENMLIGHNGEILLSDFGIASIAHQTSSMTAQQPIGTVPYMAPEQIRATPRPASDQYALAIITYEWLTGDRPFNGTYPEIFGKHLMTPPPPLRASVPELPEEVEQVVLRGLEKDPARRFPGILDFAHALEASTHSSDVTLVRAKPSMALDNPPRLASVEVMSPPSNIEVSEYKTPPPVSTGTMTPATMAVTPQSPGPQKRRSRLLVILALVACALLLLSGSFGLFAYQNHVSQAQNATATAQATASVTAALTATTQAQVNATATFTHLSPLEQYRQLKRSVPPTLNDPLQDNSHGGHWYEGNDPSGVCKFNTGHYYNIVPNGYFHACGGGTNGAVKNFVFEAQITLLEGNEGGLTFGSTSSELLAFSIAPDGSYRFTRYSRTQSHLYSLQSASSSAIKQGLKQLNVLAVMVQSQTLHFFINDQYIGNYTYDHYEGGYLGLYAAAYNQDTRAIYNNVRIWEL